MLTRPFDQSSYISASQQPSDLLDFDSPYDDSTFPKKTGKWTHEEDEILRKYAPLYGERQWRKISEKIVGRTSIQCLHRWTKILKPGLVKGPWTPEEDQRLLTWIKVNGAGKWAQAAKLIQGRSGKQCRERWFNNLNPEVKKGEWTKEEDEQIFALYQQYGSSWSQLAKMISGRTENAIKNRFYSTLRRLATVKKRKNASGSKGAMKKNQDTDEELMDYELENDEIYLEDERVESEKAVEDEAQQLSSGNKESNSLYKLLQTNTAPMYPETVTMKLSSPGSLRSEEGNTYEVVKQKQSSDVIGKRSYETMVREEVTTTKTSHSYETRFTGDYNEDRGFESFLALQGFDVPSPIQITNADIRNEQRPIDLIIDSHPEHTFNTNEPYNYGVTKPYQSTTSYFQDNHSSNISQQLPYLTENTSNKASIAPQTGFTLHRGQTSEGLFNIPSLDNDFTSGHGFFESQNPILAIPQKIVDECSAQNVDGIQRINNLIALFQSFVEQNSVNMQNSSSSFFGKERKLDKKSLKELVINMHNSIKSASTVHYNYVRYLLGVVRGLPKGDAEETNRKMGYIFGQLSSLENLLTEVRTQLQKIEASLEAKENNYLSFSGFKASEIFGNGAPEPASIKKSAITIRLGTLNSGLEEISKKRVMC